jgi:anti-anti-sigma factor
MFLIQALVDEAEWHQGPPGKSFVRLVIRLDADRAVHKDVHKDKESQEMQATTKVTQRTVTSAAGTAVTVLAFSGDISSASKDAILEAYQGLGEAATSVLLDFTAVDYINSSGIAIIIQLLLEASKSGARKVGIFGLSAHFQKVFTMVGINKYASLYPNEQAALA